MSVEAVKSKTRALDRWHRHPERASGSWAQLSPWSRYPGRWKVTD